MEFANQAHQSVYERVAGFLKELFGEYCQADSEHPRFLFRMGSALVTIMVMPWSDNAIVSTNSWVVTKVERTPALMQFLLDTNGRLVFEAFGMDQEGDVFLRHTIYGATVDKDELRTSIMGIASSADEFDDVIVSRFGGQKATD